MSWGWKISQEFLGVAKWQLSWLATRTFVSGLRLIQMEPGSYDQGMRSDSLFAPPAETFRGAKIHDVFQLALSVAVGPMGQWMKNKWKIRVLWHIKSYPVTKLLLFEIDKKGQLNKL